MAIDEKEHEVGRSEGGNVDQLTRNAVTHSRKLEGSRARRISCQKQWRPAAVLGACVTSAGPRVKLELQIDVGVVGESSRHDCSAWWPRWPCRFDVVAPLWLGSCE